MSITLLQLRNWYTCWYGITDTETTHFNKNTTVNMNRTFVAISSYERISMAVRKTANALEMLQSWAKPSIWRINSSRLSDAIWRHRFESSMAKLITCCQRTKVFSSICRRATTKAVDELNPYHMFGNNTLWISTKHPGDNESIVN